MYDFLLIAQILNGIGFDVAVKIQGAGVGAPADLLGYRGLPRRNRPIDNYALRHDGLLGLRVDLVDRARGVDVVDLAELLVVIHYRQRLRKVRIHSLLNSDLIIV